MGIGIPLHTVHAETARCRGDAASHMDRLGYHREGKYCRTLRLGSPGPARRRCQILGTSQKISLHQSSSRVDQNEDAVRSPFRVKDHLNTVLLVTDLYQMHR